MNQQQYFNPEIVVDYHQVDEYAVNAYMAKVFGWMFFGLLVTTLSTIAIILGVNASPAFAEFIRTALEFIIVVFIAEFALVAYMSSRVHVMHPSTAKMLYTIYAILNGLTFGLLVYIFQDYAGLGMETVAAAFGITALSFGAMALYGMSTRRDLASFGSLLFMGLIGIIIAGFVNMFLGSGMLEFIVLVGGLGLFLALVAYKTNVIKNYYAQAVLHGQNPDGSLTLEQEEYANTLAIYGALTLYLTFINIFLRVLMILARLKGGGGGRR